MALPYGMPSIRGQPRATLAGMRDIALGMPLALLGAFVLYPIIGPRVWHDPELPMAWARSRSACRPSPSSSGGRKRR